MTTPGFITRVQTRVFKVKFETPRYNTIGCQDVVTLAAIVDLPESTGRWGVWFEWEQISGEPTEWVIGKYDTEATFAYLTDNRDDKVFRFWVNKGTMAESYADTTVSVVPKGTVRQTTPVSSASNYSAPHAATSLVLASTAGEPTWSDITNNYAQAETLAGYDLTWVAPSTKTNLAWYDIEYFDYPTMQWKLHAKAAAATNRANIANTTAPILRLTPVYLYGGITYKRPSPTVIDSALLSIEAPTQTVALSQDNVTTTTPVNASTRIVQTFTVSTLNDTAIGELEDDMTVGALTPVNASTRIVQTFTVSTLNDTAIGELEDDMTVGALTPVSISTRVVQSLGIGSLG